MSKYIKLSFIILLLIFSYISCDSESQRQVVEALVGPDGGTVATRDGKFTLEIPPGALDEDTEITIRELNSNEFPEELANLENPESLDSVYELTPFGQEFNLPVTVSVTLDSKPVQNDGSIASNLAFVLHSSADGFEFLENPTLELDGGNDIAIVSGEIDHFSRFLTFDDEGLSFKLEGMPPAAFVNIPFTGNLTFTSQNSSVDSFELSQPGDAPAINQTAATINSNTFQPRGFIPLGGGTITSLVEGKCFEVRERRIYTFVIVIDGLNLLSSFVVLLATGGNPPEYTLTAKDFLECLAPTPTPTPSPSPSPPPLSDFDLDDILGNWEANCNATSDPPFNIILGNFGNPFNLQLEITIDPITGELSSTINILALPDLFVLDGEINEQSGNPRSFLTRQNNTSFIANAEGSGFLGDTNPTAANIIVKAEDWIFTTDGNGNPILQEGVLRFNFPGLENNTQSSTADCTGEKTE